MSGPGLVCNVGQAPAQATVVHCYPADAVHAAIEFRACRDWLAREPQAALGVVMLGFSFVLLVALSLLQRWSRRWAEASP